MDYLKTVTPLDIQDLVDYFDSVYVSGPLRKIGTT